MKKKVPEVFVLVGGTPGHIDAARQAIEQIIGRAYDAGDVAAVRTLSAVAGILGETERGGPRRRSSVAAMLEG